MQIQLSAILTSLVTLLAFLWPAWDARGQELPPKSKKQATENNGPHPVFKIGDQADWQRLFPLRRAAIDAALGALDTPERLETRDLRGQAVTVLRQLRASDDSETAPQLLRNLTLFTGGGDEPDPLRGFGAAEALVELGSHAMPALLKYLHAEHTGDELRFVVFVIERIDGAELGRTRVQLELRRVLKVFPERDESPDAYVRNLRQLEAWLSTPEFFEDTKNWPGWIDRRK